MRTPDSDDVGTGDAGSLADGFGAADLDDSGDGTGGDTYGDGYTDPDPYGDDAVSALEGAEADTSVADDDAANVFDADPGDVASDTDLDFTGDGMVDNADLHEAVAGFFDFDVDGVDPSGGAADAPPPDDGAHHTGFFDG